MAGFLGQRSAPIMSRRSSRPRAGFNPIRPAPVAAAQPIAPAAPVAPAAPARDPAAQAAIDRLSLVGSGQNLPVSQAVQDQQFSTQSGMNAAAERQQVGGMRSRAAAGGGSLYDPSLAAGEGELAQTRQLANQAAQGQISTDASRTNYDAQFAANRLLAGVQQPTPNIDTSAFDGSTGAPRPAPGMSFTPTGDPGWFGTPEPRNKPQTPPSVSGPVRGNQLPAPKKTDPAYAQYLRDKQAKYNADTKAKYQDAENAKQAKWAKEALDRKYAGAGD